MNRSICEAIGDRAVVRFSYGGGSRTVEPYCHGMSSTGTEVLRGYQTGGYSSSGKPRWGGVYSRLGRYQGSEGAAKSS
jgi:hypothetical protein